MSDSQLDLDGDDKSNDKSNDEEGQKSEQVLKDNLNVNETGEDVSVSKEDSNIEEAKPNDENDLEETEENDDKKDKDNDDKEDKMDEDKKKDDDKKDKKDKKVKDEDKKDKDDKEKGSEESSKEENDEEKEFVPKEENKEKKKKKPAFVRKEEYPVRNQTTVPKKIKNPSVVFSSVIFEGLDDKEQDTDIRKMARRDLNIAVTNNITEETTHLILGKAERTGKTLIAISRGIWIVKYDWIKSSLKKKKYKVKLTMSALIGFLLAKYLVRNMETSSPEEKKKNCCLPKNYSFYLENLIKVTLTCWMN